MLRDRRIGIHGDAVKAQREPILVGALVAVATVAHAWFEVGLWPIFAGVGVGLCLVLGILAARRLRRPR